MLSLAGAILLYRKRKSIMCKKSSGDQSGNYVAVYTQDDLDESVTIDELYPGGEKEMYA